MELLKYIKRFLGIATQNSIKFTDRLTVLLVPFGTATFWFFGDSRKYEVSDIIMTSVAALTLLSILWRLLSAPFIMWVQYQEKIKSLQKIVSDPGQQIKSEMRKYSIDLRRRLSESLSDLVSISTKVATFRLLPESGRKALADYAGESEFLPEFLRCFHDSGKLITALSYDTCLRVSCAHLQEKCARVVDPSVDELQILE
jgi:hypothetical protein